MRSRQFELLVGTIARTFTCPFAFQKNDTVLVTCVRILGDAESEGGPWISEQPSRSADFVSGCCDSEYRRVQFRARFMMRF